MRRPSRYVLTALVTLSLASPAAGAIRTGSVTVNPNPEGPQFGNVAVKPLVPVTVYYDDQAGTITISEGGAEQFPFNPEEHTSEIAARWDDLGEVSIGHCAGTIGPESSTVEIGWGQPLSWYYPDGSFHPFAGGQGLADTQIGGRLVSNATVSADGSTETSGWSDPALAGQNLTCMTFGGLGSGSGNIASTQIVFAGYAEVEPSPSPAVSTPRQPVSRTHLKVHRATRAQTHAMEVSANAHHADGFSVRTEFLANAWVTNNGWSKAEQRFRRPSNAGQRQRGVVIAFHVVGGRWPVVTYGSAICEPGQSHIPAAVCRILSL